MSLSLSYSFPKADAKNKKYWYGMYRDRLLCNANSIDDMKEITKNNEHIDVPIGIRMLAETDVVWFDMPNYVMYVNPVTDSWYDLIWHFMRDECFDGMFIDANKNVIIKNVMHGTTTGYYRIKYMSWMVVINRCIERYSIYEWIDTIPESGFHILRFRNARAVSYNYTAYMQTLFNGYRKVIDKNEYKSPKMLKDIIEGNTTQKTTSRLTDICVVCME